MNYQETVTFIEQIPKFTKKHTPEDTRVYLDRLGAPDEGMRIIHVAGTNGKGSVCSYLDHICQAEGLRTACFTSPHLVEIRERMTVNGEQISEEAFTRLAGKVAEAAIDECYPTYFEYLFHIAMLWFREEKPDIGILETGLGGRLDATNIVRHKEATVITRVGMDHMQYLGDTIPLIASEKAGIIRKDVPVIAIASPDDAFCVIKERAENVKAPLFALCEDQLRDVKQDNKGIDFLLYYRYDCNDKLEGSLPLHLSTQARYQCENSALSAICAKVCGISEQAIKLGIAATHWSGRMEEIAPFVYLDGAHNVDGMKAFLESCAHIPLKGSGVRRLLFSAVADKQFQLMLQMAEDSKLFDKLYLAPLQTTRSLTKDMLGELQREETTPVPSAIYDSAEEALEAILLERGDEDIVYVAGSLYLVGQCKAVLRK